VILWFKHSNRCLVVFHRTFDINESGELDFKEFLIGFARSSKGSLEDRINWWFNMYDCDRDGFVTLDEVTKMIQAGRLVFLHSGSSNFCL